MVSWEDGLSRGNKGPDAIKRAVSQMSAFLASMSICRSSFQIAWAVGQWDGSYRAGQYWDWASSIVMAGDQIHGGQYWRWDRRGQAKVGVWGL